MMHVCTTLYGKKILIPEDELTLRTSAYGVIVNDGKILLVNTRNTGKLWFAGGIIEEGEKPEDAVVREVFEETGLQCEVTETLGMVESYFYYDPFKEAYRQHSFYFRCRVIGGSLSTQENPDETDEADSADWYETSSLTEDQFQDYGWEVFKQYCLK
jgi:8-oxo-dGTP diphosphatase